MHGENVDPAPRARMVRPRRVAIVGPAASGKTTTLRGLIEQVRAGNLRAGGILQPAERPDSGPSSYLLEDVRTGERRPFVSRLPETGQPLFEEDGWRWALERIRDARSSSEVVIVDELGLVEAGGGGHLAALLAPWHEREAALWLLAVRDLAAERVAEHLGGFDLVLPPSRDAASLWRQIASLLPPSRD